MCSSEKLNPSNIVSLQDRVPTTLKNITNENKKNQKVVSNLAIDIYVPWARSAFSDFPD